MSGERVAKRRGVQGEGGVKGGVTAILVHTTHHTQPYYILQVLRFSSGAGASCARYWLYTQTTPASTRGLAVISDVEIHAPGTLHSQFPLLTRHVVLS